MMINDFEFSDDVLEYLHQHGHDDIALGSYTRRVMDDFAMLEPWITPGASLAWDIGCGLAGLAAVILKGTDIARIGLTDGDGTADRKMGFVDSTIGWFDVEQSAAFARANAPGELVDVVPPGENYPCDLVYSLKSWGHHYPIATYLEPVRQSLSPGGRLIIDIRTDTNGDIALAAAGFSAIATIDEKPKRRRMVFERVVDAV